MNNKITSLLLCSGGIDSCVLAHKLKKDSKNKKIILLFFNYGQRNLHAERKSIKNLSRSLKLKFYEIKMNIFKNVKNPLVSKEKFNKIKIKNLKKSQKESKKFYLPLRNTIFIIHALAFLETEFRNFSSLKEIYLGLCNEGVSPYPDTTPKFIEGINKMVKSQGLKIKIKSPLINMGKEDVISLGVKLKVNFKKTFSCYVSNRTHCGVCISCRSRQEAFYWANIRDHTKYKERMKDFRLAN